MAGSWDVFNISSRVESITVTSYWAQNLHCRQIKNTGDGLMAHRPQAFILINGVLDHWRIWAVWDKQRSRIFGYVYVCHVIFYRCNVCGMTQRKHLLTWHCITLYNIGAHKPWLRAPFAMYYILMYYISNATSNDEWVYAWHDVFPCKPLQYSLFVVIVAAIVLIIIAIVKIANKIG